jgi:outer membrane biosynthesis protein TonB
MPTLETPPNPAPVSSPPPPPKVPAGRFGELDHSELVHLLDSLDDDRARSRFRESIYISLLFYVIVGWFVLYGPRVLWHTPQVVPVAVKEEKHEMTTLETPSNLSKLLPKNRAVPRPPAPQPAPQPTQRMDEKTLRQLEAMRRPAPQPAPKPLPPAPQPQQQAQVQTPQPPRPQPPPPAPTPRPQPNQTAQSIPDAPRPSQATRPNFGSPQSPGDAIAQAAHEAALGHGGGATADGPSGRPSINSTGYEILSDTQGVDFEPYIRRLLALVRAGWIPLLPEETNPPLRKKGTTLIRFTIKSDGTLAYMHLDDSTHDRAIDEAAWGSIKSVGQYPPLPAAFKGPQLDLRIQFLVNQDIPGGTRAR